MTGRETRCFPSVQEACSGLRNNIMATTLATVEAREVLRCDHCSLVQFRTMDSHCRRCRKALEQEEPELPSLALVAATSQPPTMESCTLNVAKAVRELRQARNLSQRQLALRMQVPRTYISKIENAKATPTLNSLQRLAAALDAPIGELLHDARSRRGEAVAAIVVDPFLTELLPMVSRLNPYHRSVVLSHVRDMASGRRRPLLV